MSQGDRFEEMRAKMGLSKGKMAETLGITRDTWRRYIEGAMPTGEVMWRILDLGFSVDWLLSGFGPQFPERASPGLAEDLTRFEGKPIDAELMGRIVDAIAKLYKEENVRIQPIDQGRLAAEIYSGVDFIVGDAERMGAIRYIIQRKRAELRRTPSNEDMTKRQA